MRDSRLPLSHHLVALVVVATAIAFVWLLVRLDPDPRGHGTHEQLGMNECSWPETLGAPCPTCGCTTAAVHLLHLSPVQALLVHPFGAVLTAAGLVLAALAVADLVRGRSFVERLARLPYGTLTLVAIAVFFLSWLYKYLTWSV